MHTHILTGARMRTHPHPQIHTWHEKEVEIWFFLFSLIQIKHNSFSFFVHSFSLDCILDIFLPHEEASSIPDDVLDSGQGLEMLAPTAC